MAAQGSSVAPPPRPGLPNRGGQPKKSRFAARLSAGKQVDEELVALQNRMQGYKMIESRLQQERIRQAATPDRHRGRTFPAPSPVPSPLPAPAPLTPR